MTPKQALTLKEGTVSNLNDYNEFIPEHTKKENSFGVTNGPRDIDPIYIDASNDSLSSQISDITSYNKYKGDVVSIFEEGRKGGHDSVKKMKRTISNHLHLERKNGTQENLSTFNNKDGRINDFSKRHNFYSKSTNESQVKKSFSTTGLFDSDSFLSQQHFCEGKIAFQRYSSSLDEKTEGYIWKEINSSVTLTEGNEGFTESSKYLSSDISSDKPNIFDRSLSGQSNSLSTKSFCKEAQPTYSIVTGSKRFTECPEYISSPGSKHTSTSFDGSINSHSHSLSTTSSSSEVRGDIPHQSYYAYNDQGREINAIEEKTVIHYSDQGFNESIKVWPKNNAENIIESSSKIEKSKKKSQYFFPQGSFDSLSTKNSAHSGEPQYDLSQSFSTSTSFSENSLSSQRGKNKFSSKKDSAMAHKDKSICLNRIEMSYSYSRSQNECSDYSASNIVSEASSDESMKVLNQPLYIHIPSSFSATSRSFFSPKPICGVVQHQPYFESGDLGDKNKLEIKEEQIVFHNSDLNLKKSTKASSTNGKMSSMIKPHSSTNKRSIRVGNRQTPDNMITQSPSSLVNESERMIKKLQMNQREKLNPNTMNERCGNSRYARSVSVGVRQSSHNFIPQSPSKMVNEAERMIINLQISQRKNTWSSTGSECRNNPIYTRSALVGVRRALDNTIPQLRQKKTKESKNKQEISQRPLSMLRDHHSACVNTSQVIDSIISSSPTKMIKDVGNNIGDHYTNKRENSKEENPIDHNDGSMYKRSVSVGVRQSASKMISQQSSQMVNEAEKKGFDLQMSQREIPKSVTISDDINSSIYKRSVSIGATQTSENFILPHRQKIPKESKINHETAQRPYKVLRGRENHSVSISGSARRAVDITIYPVTSTIMKGVEPHFGNPHTNQSEKTITDNMSDHRNISRYKKSVSIEERYSENKIIPQSQLNIGMHKSKRITSNKKPAQRPLSMSNANNSLYKTSISVGGRISADSLILQSRSKSVDNPERMIPNHELSQGERSEPATITEINDEYTEEKNVYVEEKPQSEEKIVIQSQSESEATKMKHQLKKKLRSVLASMQEMENITNFEEGIICSGDSSDSVGSFDLA